MFLPALQFSLFFLRKLHKHTVIIYILNGHFHCNCNNLCMQLFFPQIFKQRFMRSPKLLVVVFFPPHPSGCDCYYFTHGFSLCLVSFFFDIGFLHFHISPIKSVSSFVLLKFGILRHDNFRLSFQNFLKLPLEEIRIVPCH